MTIQFYKINNISNKINKSLPQTPGLTLTGSLKDGSDILDPVITISNSGVPDYNYAYIAEFGRYYFVAPPTNVRKDLWEMSMHVDVLFTHRSGILSAPCIVAKSSSDYNLYLNDANYKCYQNPFIFSEAFPSGFDVSNARFIMTLFGDKVRQT